MYALMNFLHLLAAIVWLGGVSFVLVALRPAVAALLPPPQRLPLMAQVLSRFFALVWLSIGLLLLTGLPMLLRSEERRVGKECSEPCRNRDFGAAQPGTGRTGYWRGHFSGLTRDPFTAMTHGTAHFLPARRRS